MDDELIQLRGDVRYVKDRFEIEDCIARHARGHDRHDVELLSSTYHDDGVDEHGHVVNAAPDYAVWANQTHAMSSSSHLHNVTTQLCEIDGDTAHCESYVMVVLLSPDQRTTSIMNGRYVDLLERRDGAWRIAVRRATVDAVVSGDASMLSHPFFRQQGYIQGVRDESDVSYQRPTSIDGRGTGALVNPPKAAAGSRRVGKANAQMRDQVLDAVERLLFDSGYAAVTYRAVAARAGITPSLVQYYFPALDELLVATVRRRSEQSLRRLVAMLRDRPAEPLRVLWEFSNDETNVKLTIEFSALANHRESVHAEIVDHTTRLRAIQLEALELQDLGERLPPAAALFLLSGIPKLLRMEADFDIDVGHADVIGLIDRWLADLEPPAS